MFNSKYICILGSGGHSKCVLDIIYKFNYINNTLLFPLSYDDDVSKNDTYHYYSKIVGTIMSCDFVSNYLFCAIGNNKTRKQITEHVNHVYDNLKMNPLWIKITGSNSSISLNTIIGEGTIIMNNVNIGPDVVIGKHCIINNNVNIDHDCVIGNYTHVAPGTTLCGNVCVGNGTLIGAGSVIVPNIKIGDDLLIKAHSLIKTNVLTNNS